MLTKYKIKFYQRLMLTYFSKKYKMPQNHFKNNAIKKVAVLYSIPKNSPRINTWNDGFVDAIRILDNEYSFNWINIETEDISEELLNSFDFLLAKSNWGWGPDKLLRNKFKNLKVKKGLAIAGVSIPPTLKEMLYYDVLWYETNWYRRIIRNHPNIFHGFGINKNSLTQKKQRLEYDYISIGAFLPHKRMHLIAKLKGKVLIIGEEYENSYSKSIFNRLKKMENVDIKPFVEYSQLSNYFALAHTLYIPAAINGGGERAILEARHCGLDIKIESDNTKLKEIKNSPIWDSLYYANQIRKGIKSII